MKPSHALFSFTLLMALGSPALLQGQTTATLSGRVTDASDAVIQNTRVTATSKDTGTKREGMTDDQGVYRIILLPPGVYEVKVEKEGFTGQVRSNVTLTVGQAGTMDFKLAVGQSKQVVEVESEVPLVETERTQQSNTLGQQEVSNLPINRRDYLSFVLLAPGVVDSKGLADSTSYRVKQTPESGLSFYGSNGRGNNITVDGGEANDSGGGVRPTVSQEAVQEFQINRSNYSAEMGAARGGVVNIVTRSGANQVRGSAFGFFRHQSMDATDPFALVLQGNQVVRMKPDANRQQFGGTVGGPIAKDKTFYFFSFEQLRRRENASVPLLTNRAIFQPTPAQEAILRQLPADAAGQLRAALSAPATTVKLFEQNSGEFPYQTDDHKGLVKLDHRFNEQNTGLFRFNTTRSYDTNPNLSGLTGQSRGYVQDTTDANALLGWTRTFSPTLLNEARAQFNYSDVLTQSTDPNGPALEIGGFGFFNRDRFLPSESIVRRWELSDSVSAVRGGHSLKFGVYTLIRSNYSDSQTFFSGRFVFGALPGAAVSPALASTSITALQAFNLGLPQAFQIGLGDPVVKATYPLYAAYVQDAWRVGKNLTFNMGVRWEADTRKSPMPSNYANFSPRFGFAWDPTGDKKTTIRGGFGMFYAPIDFQIDYVATALGEINGYRQIAQVLTVGVNPADKTGPVNIWRTLVAQKVIGVPGTTRPLTTADFAQFGINFSQTGPRPPLTVLFSASPDYRNPNAQQASFTIEREIVPGMSVSAGYIYAHGVHLTTSYDQNLLPAPVNPLKGIRDWGVTASNPSGAAYFRNPLLYQDNVYSSGAVSSYNGLIVEFTKRMSKGIAISSNYTFSKAIDETTDYNSDFQPNDQTCRRCERALSSFDQRHKFVVYGVFQTPGKGGSTLGRVFADFQLTPIFRANSGRPFNLLANTELNNDRHNTTDRPFYAGRNTGLGPKFRTFDLRLVRTVRFQERRTLELMAEAFNLLNNLNYASVNNTVGNVAGPFRLTGRDDRGPSDPLGFTAAADPRRIQLGLRLRF